MTTNPAPAKTDYLPYAPAPEPGTGPRPLAAILDDLARPVHQDYLATLTKKGQEITFLHWYDATRMLDRYAPGWQSRTHTQLALDGLHVAVDVEIGIPTSDYGMVWRSSSGSDVVSEKAYGDATDRAESQALRRAASKFRLGLYLYYEKGAGGPTQRAPTPAASVAAKPTSNAPPVPPTEDGISKADLTTIRNAVAALGWGDPDKAHYLARYNVRLLSDLSATVGATVARDLAQQATQQHAPAAPGPGDPLFTDGPIRTWDQTPARPEVTA